MSPSFRQTLLSLADLALLRGDAAAADDLRRHAANVARDETAVPDADAAARAYLADLETAAAEPDQTVDRLTEHLPDDLRRLVTDGGLAVRDVLALHRETGATSAGDLASALEDGVLADTPLAGLSPALREALPRLRASGRLALGRGLDLVGTFLAAVGDAAPSIARVEPVGSLRRFSATVGDLELLAATADPDTTIREIRDRPSLGRVVHAGERAIVLRAPRGQITLRMVGPDRWGAALAWQTGSPAHVRALRARAAARGGAFAPDGLTGPNGRPVETPDEESFYAALGLPWITPELREDGDELAAAESGALPVLVAREDIRGDLHMHSDWSDGRDTIEAMLRAAALLGYDYVALTDHSKSSAVAGGLDADRLAAQRDALAAARDAVPGLVVLHGSEVDILPDGSLDFPDAVLETLDVVLASLHDAAGHDGARLTDRYCAAMRHPLVQIVTHPTNRLVPHREGYALDEARLFATAVETGTVLEIDGAPGHLDMDGAMARRALAAGVDVSVDGDCHVAARLGAQMMLGVATARRGWVTPDRVVNTRPLDALMARLNRKRAGRA